MIRARESKAAPVGVVGKVLSILEALDASPLGLQLREISQQTGVHKSTAYRFLAHLENEGYLYRDDAGAYIVGPKLARLGAGVSYHATLRRVSRPVLQDIWKATTETVNLAVLEGDEALYLDVLESPHQFRLVSEAGMRRPLNCTSLGKSILAYLPSEQREDVFTSLTWTRFTPYTIRNLAQLRKELDRVRRMGYALDEQETVVGARCVAAPIMDQSGKVAAAVSVSGPTTRITRSRVPLLAETVKGGAHHISRLLGYAGRALSA